MINYFVFTKKDVEKYEHKLIQLMDMILRDNISQEYPKELAKEYVHKWPSYIEDGSAYICGAEDKDELVGFLWAYELTIFGERRLHVDMIGVDEQYRGHGIASKFMDLQIDEANRRGISIIEAMTTCANSNSYNWFHSMGFQDERAKVRLEIK